MSSLRPPIAQPYTLLKGKTHCKQTSVCEREYKGMHLREKKKEEQGVCESTETCNAVQSNVLYRQWELYALEQNKK